MKKQPHVSIATTTRNSRWMTQCASPRTHTHLLHVSGVDYSSHMQFNLKQSNATIPNKVIGLYFIYLSKAIFTCMCLLQSVNCGPCRAQVQNQLPMIACVSCNLKNTLGITHRPLPFMLMSLPLRNQNHPQERELQGIKQ